MNLYIFVLKKKLKDTILIVNFKQQSEKDQIYRNKKKINLKIKHKKGPVHNYLSATGRKQ